MIRLLGLFAVLTLAGFVAAWVADEPGELVFAWRDWEMRASFGVSVFALAAVVLLALGFGALLREVSAVPGRFRRGRMERNRRKGWRALEAGLSAAAGGDTRQVHRALRGARRLPEDAPLRLLLEAEAARLDGDALARHRVFDRMAKHGMTETVALRGLVAELRGQEAYKEAMELVRRALKHKPAPEWALRESLALAFRLRLWELAAETFSEMRGQGLVARDEADRSLGLIAIERARSYREQGVLNKAVRTAGEAISALPGVVPVAIVAGEIYLEAGKTKRAAKIASAAWQKDPHPALAEIILSTQGSGDELEEMKALEDLTVSNSADPTERHVALARAALKAKLWGLAGEHLRAAMTQGGDARAFRLRAELERSEHGDRGAETRWLERALDAPSAPAWVCGSCGKECEEWSAVCGRCYSFDGMEWRSVPASGTEEKAGGLAEVEAVAI